MNIENLAIDKNVFISEGNEEIENIEKMQRYFDKLSKFYGVFKSILSKNENTETIHVQNHLCLFHNTIALLSKKYTSFNNKCMKIDTTDSGFPSATEIRQLYKDITDAKSTADIKENITSLKKKMVDHILSKKTFPTAIQQDISYNIFLLSCNNINSAIFKLYNDVSYTLTNVSGKKHSYDVSWSLYDTIQNIPVIYLMKIEVNKKMSSDKLKVLFHRLNEHLKTNSLSTLNLLTIISNIDEKFNELSPISLKRMFVGPMYSNAYTKNKKYIDEVLAKSSIGNDWMISWTQESIISQDRITRKVGIFKSVEKQIYYVDSKFKDRGLSAEKQFVIMPYENYQYLYTLTDNPLIGVEKYIIHDDNTFFYDEK